MALLIYCDYCPLSKDQRKKLLTTIYDSLKVNGMLFFDIFSIKAFSKREGVTRFGKNIMDKFWSEEEYYCFVNSFKYEKDTVFLDKYTIIEKNRTFEVFNWLKYFSLDEILNEIKESGFEIINYYSDITGKEYNIESDTIAIACKKV